MKLIAVVCSRPLKLDMFRKELFDGGYGVITADSMSAGLQLTERYTVDLLIIDATDLDKIEDAMRLARYYTMKKEGNVLMLLDIPRDVAPFSFMARPFMLPDFFNKIKELLPEEK